MGDGIMNELIPFNEEHASLFKDVVFIVEADSYARNSLWCRYHSKPEFEDYQIKTWELVNPGCIVTIGHYGNAPVCVELYWNMLNGNRVMFYYATSLVVNHDMVEKWLRNYSSNITWDNGARWAHCDALNFHHCVEVVTKG